MRLSPVQQRGKGTQLKKCEPWIIRFCPTYKVSFALLFYPDITWRGHPVEMSDGLASSSSKSDFLVNGKYRLVRKIGSGSFGDIYLGINVSNGEVWTLLFVFDKMFTVCHLCSSHVLIANRC